MIIILINKSKTRFIGLRPIKAYFFEAQLSIAAFSKKPVYTVKRKKNTLIMAFVAILFTIAQIDLWVGQGGLLQFLQLKNEVRQQHAENTLLEVRNSILHAEVLDLKGGYDAIEERARVELGMIKPNETFYQPMSKAHDASQE
ncbi:MAG: cell division protein FtsB [Gammaproteobacteria bacterium]|jgi:cell division protein FtsB